MGHRIGLRGIAAAVSAAFILLASSPTAGQSCKGTKILRDGRCVYPDEVESIDLPGGAEALPARRPVRASPASRLHVEASGGGGSATTEREASLRRYAFLYLFYFTKLGEAFDSGVGLCADHALIERQGRRGRVPFDAIATIDCGRTTIRRDGKDVPVTYCIFKDRGGEAIKDLWIAYEFKESIHAGLQEIGRVFDSIRGLDRVDEAFLEGLFGTRPALFAHAESAKEALRRGLREAKRVRTVSVGEQSYSVEGDVGVGTDTRSYSDLKRTAIDVIGSKDDSGNEIPEPLARSIAVVLCHASDDHGCLLRLFPSAAEATGRRVQEALAYLAADTGCRRNLEEDRVQGTGDLAVHTDPPGATVGLDGRAVGRTPLQLAVPAGAHRISVTLEGWIGETKMLQVPAAGRIRFDARLARRGSGPGGTFVPGDLGLGYMEVPPPPELISESRSRCFPNGGWLTLAIASAAAHVSGIVLLSLSEGPEDDGRFLPGMLLTLGPTAGSVFGWRGAFRHETCETVEDESAKETNRNRQQRWLSESEAARLHNADVDARLETANAALQENTGSRDDR